ncbi:MAG TPA: hypothetical protein VG389_15535 [Myxococcota bacterium]|nr:hypothetical protein [Myxococcota bacterium]
MRRSAWIAPSWGSVRGHTVAAALGVALLGLGAGLAGAGAAGCLCAGHTRNGDGAATPDGGGGDAATPADRDGDGLSDDCEKSAPGLDPDDPDSDGDGLLDGAEDANRNCRLDPGETDPRAADTDGDGVADDDESTCGFDPTVADTDGDMVPDGMEPCGAACSESNLVMPVLNVSPVTEGDWQVATPATTAYAPLAFMVGPYAAAVVDEDDPATGIEMAGFVMNLDPAGAGYTGTTAAALAVEIGARLGGAAVADPGRDFTDYAGNDARVEVVYTLTAGAASNAGAVRNDAVAAIAAQPLASIMGLPPALGATATDFVVRYAVTVRAPDRVVVVGAVLRAALVFDLSNDTMIRVRDLTNGTALADADDELTFDCESFVTDGPGKVDLVWALDDSASMTGDLANVQANTAFFLGLLGMSGVDYRLGATWHSCRNLGNPANTVGLGNTPMDVVTLIRTNEIAGTLNICSDGAERDPVNGILCDESFTPSIPVFSTCIARRDAALCPLISNVPCGGTNDPDEYTLSSALMAVDRALPRAAADVAKIRTDALLAVIVITDEHEDAFEREYNYGNGALDPVATPVAYANMVAMTDPYIAWLAQPEVAARVYGLFGVPGLTGSAENDAGIQRVIDASTGIYGHIAQADNTVTMSAIVLDILSQLSDVELSQDPISMTLKVSFAGAGMPAIDVPRSRLNGFDYDAASRKIIFAGIVPQEGDELYVSYRLWTPFPPVR